MKLSKIRSPSFAISASRIPDLGRPKTLRDLNNSIPYLRTARGIDIAQNFPRANPASRLSLTVGSLVLEYLTTTVRDLLALANTVAVGPRIGSFASTTPSSDHDQLLAASICNAYASLSSTLRFLPLSKAFFNREKGWPSGSVSLISESTGRLQMSSHYLVRRSSTFSRQHTGCFSFSLAHDAG